MTSSNSVPRYQDPLLEMPRYCQEALRTAAEGEMQQALGWRLVRDAAANFSRACVLNYILFPQEGERAAQHHNSLFQQKKGAIVANHPWRSDWIFATEGPFQEIAERYCSWMLQLERKSSLQWQQEIAQATEAAHKYQRLAPTVAFFAQQSAAYFQKARDLRTASPDLVSLELYRWQLAAHQAAEVAGMYLHVEASRSRNNKILMHHWKEAARYGEEAFHFRIQAAAATQQEDEERAIGCSLAAHAATHVSTAHATLLELFPAGDERLIAHELELLQAAERVVECRKESILAEKKEAWEQAAFWSEHHYEVVAKVIELYLPHAPAATARWEAEAERAKKMGWAMTQAARSQNGFKKKIARLYWYLKVSYAVKRHQKKMRQRLATEVFFCLPAPLLPEKMRSLEVSSHFQKAFADAPLFVDVLFHNWIYQTWKLLREAGISCQLATQPIKTGIMITICQGFSATLMNELLSSKDLFLVNVVADTLEPLSAHRYLVQNAAAAKQRSNALFMPHWPQPGLIPRDGARGTRFEKICFFGTAHNLAPEFFSLSWRERLQKELGLDFEIRERGQWHNYSDVDGVIAIRDFSDALHLHKPATKLYNAWLAGVPFIGGRDAAYACDGDPGKNYLVATSLEEVFQYLKMLREQEAWRAKLVANGVEAGKAFSQEATLERWKKLVEETLPRMVHQPRAYSNFL